MKHTEHDYIEAGYRVEKAKTPSAYTAETQRIRVMFEDETPDDQTAARHLIAQGIREARL